MSEHGVIVKLVAGDYTVRGEFGTAVCRGCGRFRNEDIKPMVGDRALIERNNDGTGVITDVLPRRNSLVRPPVANLDRLVITVSAQKPQADLMLVDTLMIWCLEKGIEPMLFVNKCDLDADNAEAIASQYRGSGCKVLVASSLNSEDVARLYETVSTGITAFAGQSGVGKTTLISSLIPDYGEKTGELSRKTGRGRHTTRHCELIALNDNGFLVDTPGFSLIEFETVDPTTLKDFYREFEGYASECRYNGCNHISEPQCAVKAAVENNLIDVKRYERYSSLYKELSEKWRKRYD